MPNETPLQRRDLADTPELEPDMLARVEAALDGLELFGARGARERMLYAQQVVREADRAGCEEIATMARIIAAGNGKLTLNQAIALSRQALRQHRES